MITVVVVVRTKRKYLILPLSTWSCRCALGQGLPSCIRNYHNRQVLIIIVIIIKAIVIFIIIVIIAIVIVIIVIIIAIVIVIIVMILFLILIIRTTLLLSAIVMKYEILKSLILQFRSCFCRNCNFSFSYLEMCSRGPFQRFSIHFQTPLTPRKSGFFFWKGSYFMPNS